MKLGDKIELGEIVQIPAAEIEFRHGGNTIWVHSPSGGTILRIKCSGKITAVPGCENLCSHGDIMVKGDIEICIADDFAL